MDHIEFWGITFRSLGHLGWFQLTMVVLVTSVLYYGWCVTSARRLFMTYPLWWWLGFFQSGASVVTALIIAGRYQQQQPLNGATYSVDCIWFNALIGSLYLLLWWTTKKLAEKREEQKDV